MKNKPWTPEDIEQLKSLIEANKTKTEISQIMGRTTTAIQIKSNRLGIAVYNTSDNPRGYRGRDWRESDIEMLKELWADPTVSPAMMQSKLRRSYYSIRRKSQLLNLGPRDYNTEFLSIRTISEEMNVSLDRIQNWFRLGLPRRKSKSGKTKFLVDVNDLLKFLESHQNVFNASDVSLYLFPEEPQWLQDKRSEDFKKYPKNLHREYTNQEDMYISDAFRMKKSDEEIAKVLGRTAGSVRDRRHILNLMKGTWTTEEEQVLRKWSRYKTLSELSSMLGRTQKAIEYRCRVLGLPYHLSKAKCDDPDES